MPTSTYRARAFLRAAARLGIEVTVGSEQAAVLAHLTPGTTLALPFDNLDAALDEVVRFAETYPLRAVVGVDDAGVLLAATAAATLGLRNASIEAVAATRDKHRFRQRLQAAGLPCPWFRLLSVDDDPAAVGQELRYPCVLKPLALAASRGVIRANTPAEFEAAFRRVAAILKQGTGDGGQGSGVRGQGPGPRDPQPETRNQKPETRNQKLLVESYIPGIEVAVEGLILAGEAHVLAVFDKPDPLEGPFFEETIYVTPSRLPPETQGAVIETVCRTVRALGLRQGPLHAELRIDPAGTIWPIDVAARSIGGLCSNALRFGSGDSLEELILRQAVGLPLESLEREQPASGVMMIPIPRGGILREVRGCDAAEAVPGVEEVTMSIPIGGPVVPLPEGDRYLGFIFARGETPEEVEAALREAHRRLELRIE